MAQTMLRNLAAIVQNTANENIRMIDIAELHESPDNFFRIEHIEELAYTILAQGGVKDNLIVTPLATGGYEIVSGHRRKAAVQYLLDHDENISRLLPCLVQRYSDEDSKRLDLISMNVTTRQLSDQELWQSFRVLDGILQARKGAGEKFGRMREFLAQQLGTSRSQISKLQHISSSAEPEIQDALAEGTLSINTANEIAKLEPEQQHELAQGDLHTVTPTAIRQAAEPKGTSAAKPLTIRWDGELLADTVRQQLMYLVHTGAGMREKACDLNRTDFTNEFRKQFLSQRFDFIDGITILCGFDRIAISFSSPSDFQNISTIEIIWKMAAKYVQNWIREESAAAEDTEKVDRPVTFSSEPPAVTDEQEEVDRPVTFSADNSDPSAEDTLHFGMMPQEQRDCIFNTGCFNSIALGYLTLTLQEMGMDAETVIAAQKQMSSIFDSRTAAAARKAYNES